MSFQRMIVSGSAPERKSSAIASREQPVALVLELAQRSELVRGVLEALEPLHRLVQARRGAVDHLGLLVRLERDLAHLVGVDVVGSLVDVVADVVEHRRELVHVVAIERRHERAVQQVDHLARQPVALVLELADVGQLALGVRPILEQLDEQPRDVARVGGGLGEQVEEAALLRGQAERHRRGSSSYVDRTTKQTEQERPATKQ